MLHILTIRELSPAIQYCQITHRISEGRLGKSLNSVRGPFLFLDTRFANMVGMSRKGFLGVEDELGSSEGGSRGLLARNC